MPRIVLLHIAIYLSISTGCLAQHHENLLKVIESSEAFDIKQQKIDSFLINDTSKIPPETLADCYHDLGSKWYFPNRGRFGKSSNLKMAIMVTQKALDLKRQSDNLENCSLNKTLYNLAFFHTFNNAIYDAIDIYLEIIQKGTEYCTNADKDKIQYSRQELGKLFIMTGDYYKALEMYENIILTYKRQESLDNAKLKIIILAYIKIAEIYYAIDVDSYSKKIKTNLELADRYLKESSLECCNFQNRINQIEGNRLMRNKEYLKATKYHNEIIKNLPENDSLNIAIVYNSIAISYLLEKEYELAYKNLQEAMGFDSSLSESYENLGDFYMAKKEFSKALNQYQKAINYSIDHDFELNFEQLPSNENLELSPNKIFLLNHLVTKANGWIKYYEHDGNNEHLDHALETFNLADQLVDLIRFESTEHQSKLFWREQGAQLYMKAVAVCYLLNKPEEAFHFMERNKALLLLEDLTHMEAKEIAQLPQALAQQEFKLKRSIFLEENELYEIEHEGKESSDSLKSVISDSKYRYEQFVDSLNQAYPDYAKFKKKANILTLNKLQSNYISDDQVVLHYILNEEDGYGLLTDADGPIIFQLEDTAHLNDQIDSFISLLSSGISDISTFNTTSHTLFKNLIPADIYNKIKDKQLIIVPDYTLQRIPFETLVVDKANTKYLIEEAEISYVYSMSLLDHNKGSTRNHSTQLLGLAPIHFDKLGLVELSNSESEISGIAPLFDGQIFLDDQASKANFLKEVAGPKIIHLATHAVLGDGENPWIAFSDEKMYLKEIYATKNESEMVVLSACNTLNGDLKRGEGVMSLARGFFYSGAKSVVSSLWPLTDEAGSDIMISFYRNLDKGYTKSKALRQAKLDYMSSNIVEELKHPFYWAGFVVVGDNAPLVSAWNPNWIYIGIVLILAILYLFRRKFFKGL